jgi:hypothetical protein
MVARIAVDATLRRTSPRVGRSKDGRIAASSRRRRKYLYGQTGARASPQTRLCDPSNEPTRPLRRLPMTANNVGSVVAVVSCARAVPLTSSAQSDLSQK